MQDRDKLYINGEWTPSQGKGVIEIINPATELVIGHIPEGTAEDAAAAVTAAAAAFEQWSGTPREERAAASDQAAPRACGPFRRDSGHHQQ